MRSLIALMLVLVMTGCATNNPYTDERETSNATKGSIYGALGGAILGSLIKDNKEGVLVGAVSGAAIGGGIGYKMDQQEAELRRILRGTGVKVSRVGNRIQLIMPGDVTFATGEAAIKSSFYDVLDSVSMVVKHYNHTRVKVSGHTDSTGAAQYNQTLSEQRALSVKRYLQSRGIAAGRMIAYGYGERYPVGSNDSPFGRQANRRVEIELEEMR